MKRSSKPGFTLLELLVAAALAAVVASAVAVLFGRGLHAWQQANERLTQLFGIEKGLNRLGEELRNSVFLASTDPPFVGEKDRVVFFMAQGPDRLTQVTYSVSAENGRSTWVREAEPFPALQETTPEVAPPKVIAQVSDFSVRYGYLRQEEGGPTLRWEEAWDTPQLKQLPRLIQVRLEAQDRRFGSQTVTREVWIPQGVLGSYPGE